MLFRLLSKIADNGDNTAEVLQLSLTLSPSMFRPLTSAYMSIKHMRDLIRIRPIIKVFIENYEEIYTMVEMNRDNYFNNSIYLDGWSYNSQSIGTPFFLDKNFLKLSDTNPVKFRNTRVQSFILYLSGNFNNLYFLSRFSKTINYGTYFSPLKFNQNNIFFNFSYLCR